MYSEIAHTYIWLKILYILLMKGLVFGELVGFKYELEFSSIRTYYRDQFTTSAHVAEVVPKRITPMPVMKGQTFISCKLEAVFR